MEGLYYLDCFTTWNGTTPENSYGPSSWQRCLDEAAKLRNISGIRKVVISPATYGSNPMQLV